MFVWTCGGPQSSRQVKSKFGHSLEIFSINFTEVVESINRMVVDIIEPKDSQFNEVYSRLQELHFWAHLFQRLHLVQLVEPIYL